MANSYASIISRIKKLQKRADKLAKGRSSAVAKVKKLIKAHELTAEEIGLGRVQRTARNIGRRVKRVAPKYRSPAGETWTGRGLMPRWLRDAMKKGKKREDFLIKALKSGR